jgi:hypothetical protein
VSQEQASQVVLVQVQEAEAAAAAGMLVLALAHQPAAAIAGELLQGQVVWLVGLGMLEAW